MLAGPWASKDSAPAAAVAVAVGCLDHRCTLLNPALVGLNSGPHTWQQALYPLSHVSTSCWSGVTFFLLGCVVGIRCGDTPFLLAFLLPACVSHISLFFHSSVLSVGF